MFVTVSFSLDESVANFFCEIISCVFVVHVCRSKPLSCNHTVTKCGTACQTGVCVLMLATDCSRQCQALQEFEVKVIEIELDIVSLCN